MTYNELALSRSHDDFYHNQVIPIDELAAMGDVVAAETIADRDGQSCGLIKLVFYGATNP